MKKLCSLVIGMLSILLLSGPMASAANGITVRGQSEGAYAENIYRFVTSEGQEIPAMMENGGKIMSYTPFQASGYIAHNQAQQSILIIQKVAYAGRGLNLFTFACCLSHLQRIPVCRCLTLVY